IFAPFKSSNQTACRPISRRQADYTPVINAISLSSEPLISLHQKNAIKNHRTLREKCASRR
ncbi:hypothetical protein, partial [Aggregatibacter actinomycetemcomitans]|uniref:hypothetical protein n=1 Tax=Aggregatibacter actinomycetemcomitans TaxID=714 RepID=UPI001E318F76